MKIDKLSDLKKLLVACRAHGVNVIKVDGLEIVLEGKPESKTTNKVFHGPRGPTDTLPGIITEDSSIDTPDTLTEEQLLMWSAGSGAGEG